jgi:hypothetical protein
MRKLISFPVLVAGLMLLVQSCSKQSRDEMGIKETEVINATVSVSSPYLLNVNNFGSITIEKQAAYFDISKTETNESGSGLVYRYVPKAGYKGPDEVELIGTKTFDRSAQGCGYGGGVATSSKHTQTSRMLIKFTVTD